MRRWGDEADSAALEEAIKKIVSPTLSTTSVYRVTPHIFRSLSDAVLHELRDKLSSGWKQVNNSIHTLDIVFKAVVDKGMMCNTNM